jgi:serine/threonine-protein kinase
MGRVLLARDGATGDRLVALKVLLTDTRQRPLLEARFQREVRNLALLRHPGIVTVFTAGTLQGHPYLAMDYVEGRDLRAFIHECAHLGGRRRIERIATVMAQVARAVAYAHAKGVVHRDIKPSNVLVSAEADEAVLLDFGISKCLDDIGLTGMEMPGTAPYMAPEQFDARLLASEQLIDVWALGVNLYFALTGELPFKGETHLAVSHDVVYSDPEPPSRINGRIPARLEEIVLACMRKDPRERIPSAAALSRLLDEALGSSSDRVATSAAIAPAAPAEHATWAAATLVPTRLRTLNRARRGAAAALGVALALASVAAAMGARSGWPDASASRVAPGDAARPAEAATPGLPPPFAEPRVRALLAGDEEVVRSVLLYTAEIDVRSRRGILSAFRELHEGHAARALPKLQVFARDNPKSPLASLVRFWIGTASLALGRSKDAVREYEEIVRAAPHSELAPRALLFAASALRAGGDDTSSRLVLQRLAHDYPDSRAAREAQPTPAG